MKKHLIAIAAAAMLIPAAAKVNPNDVLMTVDGRPVTVGEFEYLYNKNKAQQTTPQTFDQYLLMFENYKLKVADAEHADIDKTEAFRSEFTKFRDELAAPYLRDQATEDALVEEAYSHRKNDVYVSHIMVQLEPADNEARLDSLRNEILAGNISFEKAAADYSVDRGSSQQGGRMGFVVPERFPWAFEKASYDTKVGEISPVINSGVGYHIIRVESVSPSQGEVDASHILLMTRGLDDEAKAAVKYRIDSLYLALAQGADFAATAKKFSQDPGSAAKGGALGRFGHGAMVAEFDSAAFATPDGEFSKPFATAYGYHIVKTNKHYGLEPLNDEVRKAIITRMSRDERAQMPEKAGIDKLMLKYKATVDTKTMADIKALIAANGGTVDSTVVARLTEMDKTPIATYTGGSVSVRDAIAYIPMPLGLDSDAFTTDLDQAADNALRAAVREKAIDELALTNTDYRNLVNEYRDGILLYEVSNQQVWDKAAKDKEGLEEYFAANRDKYRWDSPRFNSYVFFAKNDTVLAKALEYAETLAANTDPQQLTKDMRKQFGRDIKVERVIAAKGENAITDYLAFEGDEEAARKQSKWPFFAAWHGRLVEQPETAADVRGAAVTDYQNYLEQQWLDQLHKRYTVKVNNKVLKKLRQEEEGK